MTNILNGICRHCLRSSIHCIHIRTCFICMFRLFNVFGVFDFFFMPFGSPVLAFFICAKWNNIICACNVHVKMSGSFIFSHQLFQLCRPYFYSHAKFYQHWLLGYAPASTYYRELVCFHLCNLLSNTNHKHLNFINYVFSSLLFILS